jgi:CubicO group peptidase (beta-lactamase class C family)
VEKKAYGDADIASGKPMQLDSIVRVYSMSKPITGIAMMMLYEQGKWKPGDPIAKYIPEFKDLKVFASMGPDGKPVLVAPNHAPTMGELMTHTAGFTYGFFGSTPVDLMYRAANPLGAKSLKEFVGRIAKLPLRYQPGEEWQYSLSVDIQGYLIEQMSGESFPDFARTRIFEPLGMHDTGFSVPADKLDRVATIYTHDHGAEKAMPRDAAISQTPGLASGGGGIYSTAEDYRK